jgi:hypothetical protein
MRLICDRRNAGEMVEYSRTVGKDKPTLLSGTRCNRCGFTLLDDDDDVWSAIGL